MLSICIPTYNYNPSPLLSSLLEQASCCSFTIEILVIDDASTFETSFSEELLADNRVQITRNSHNLGRTATRSLLAEKAQFDWLLFLDADTLPINAQFLVGYEKYFAGNHQVICGGISYQDTLPKADVSLRWKFGRQREARRAVDRKKAPFHIVSGNLLIQKDAFAKANPKNTNSYGLDNIFSNRLRQLAIEVLHIDNSVYHLGLETNEIFLQKSLKAIEIIVHSAEMTNTHTRLQQGHIRLKKMGLEGVFYYMIKPLKGILIKNLHSNRPSLRVFDILRLYHYIHLKKHA